METVVEVTIAIVSALTAIAVSWGMVTTKLSELRKEVDSMKDEMKQMMTEKQCILKHGYIDKSMEEIKQSIYQVGEALHRIEEYLRTK